MKIQRKELCEDVLGDYSFFDDVAEEMYGAELDSLEKKMQSEYDRNNKIENGEDSEHETVVKESFSKEKERYRKSTGLPYGAEITEEHINRHGDAVRSIAVCRYVPAEIIKERLLSK